MGTKKEGEKGVGKGIKNRSETQVETRAMENVLSPADEALSFCITIITKRYTVWHRDMRLTNRNSQSSGSTNDSFR